MEETGTLQRGQQTSQIMVGEIKNLSPQTLVQMESGTTTMEIQLHNLYVSITQVLDKYIPTYRNHRSINDDLLRYMKY